MLALEYLHERNLVYRGEAAACMQRHRACKAQCIERCTVPVWMFTRACNACRPPDLKPENLLIGDDGYVKVTNLLHCYD